MAWRQERERAARRLQAAFRGWRVRRRVVWAVREELEEFLVEMETHVEMERLLLGLAKPQTHNWKCAAHDDDEDTVRWRLQVPRIEDDVFGWRGVFPDPVATDECFWEEHRPASPRHDTNENSGPDEDFADAGSEKSAGSPQPSSSDSIEETQQPQDARVPDHCSLENGSPFNESLAGQEDTTYTSPATDSRADDSPSHGKVEEQECLDSVQLQEDDVGDASREPVIATSSSSSETDELVGQATEDCESATPVSNSGHSMLEVDKILSSHTKEDIILELAWAKQALRDRLRYLRLRSSSAAPR